MLNILEARHIKRLYIQSQGAEPTPPLGTILGNLGVNTSNFCNSYNQYTKNLPYYFLLKVNIYIYDNRATNFNVDFPSISHIINLLKFERIVKVEENNRLIDKLVYCIKLFQVLKLAKLKFPEIELKKSFSILLGTVKSMEINIVHK